MDNLGEKEIKAWVLLFGQIKPRKIFIVSWKEIFMNLIIFAHPDNKNSHNAAILRYVIAYMNKSNEEFEVIDLYEDGFDPVLRLTKEDSEKVNLVERYRELVAESSRIIFIFPVWWYNMPAILKGFIEIVFHSGMAYSFIDVRENRGEIEKRFNGKTAVVINTYGRTKDECAARGNPLQIIFDKAILEFCGMRVAARVEWFEVRAPSLLKPDIAREISRALNS